MFFALSETYLKSGGYVVGAGLNDDFTVSHLIADSNEERDKILGSKYVQSSIGMVYRNLKKLLDDGHNVLFSGTPCQVAGLNAFLGKDYSNLLTVDILCHGVPSDKLFLEYLAILEKKYGKVLRYQFRDRMLGMSGSNVHVWFENDKEVMNNAEVNAFDKLYSRGYIMRESCYECQYTTIGRTGDISIGDYWGIEGIRPDWNTNDGASIVMINSEKGINAWNVISKNFVYFSTSYDECKQESLHTPVRRPVDYNLFWKVYKDKGFKTCEKIFADTSSISKMYLVCKKVKERILKV